MEVADGHVVMWLKGMWPVVERATRTEILMAVTLTEILVFEEVVDWVLPLLHRAGLHRAGMVHGARLHGAKLLRGSCAKHGSALGRRGDVGRRADVGRRDERHGR